MDIELIKAHMMTFSEVAAWPDMVELFDRAGSLPRPDWSLPLIACQAVGGRRSAAIPAAAALACMQLSIMLVDDILDEDLRGAHLERGVGHVANLALAFQAAAFRVIAVDSIELHQHAALMSRLAWMAQTTALGQNWDAQNLSGEENYWKVIRAKSTPFYGTALYAGALIGNAPSHVADRLMEYGALIGEVIQVVDDLADAFEAPANPDWKQGRNNLAILYAQTAEHKQHSHFESLLSRIDDPAALTEAQHILVKSGAVSYCTYQLIARYHKAKSTLDALALVDRDPLTSLLANQAQTFAGLLDACGADAPAELVVRPSQ